MSWRGRRCHELVEDQFEPQVGDPLEEAGQGGTLCATAKHLARFQAANTLELVMTNPTGEIGQLREEELPVVRVIVPPDPSGRVFVDDLDPGDLVFDGKLTPMLVWHERYPIGRGWRSGWVLSYVADGEGNSDDYIVGLGLPDVDAAVAQAREYLRSL